MLSSKRCLAAALLFAASHVQLAHAAALPAEGFNIERLYRAPAGVGFWVMDDLNFVRTLSGAMGLSLGYAYAPLRVSDGTNHFSVVSSDLSASFAAAMTWRIWRFHVDMGLPVVIVGQSGSVQNSAFVGPSLTPSSLPDPMSDIRIGVDARLLGAPDDRVRLGVGAHLIVPSGRQMDYDTDGSFRGMFRALIAGDLPWLRWAGHVGAHVRPRDDAGVFGSPQGSELLFGGALAVGIPLGATAPWAMALGPEVWGATAFDHFFAGDATALEGLVTARLETTGTDAMGLRIKAGVGAGLHAQFGAPTWRVVTGIEIFSRSEADRPPSTATAAY